MSDLLIKQDPNDLARDLVRSDHPLLRKKMDNFDFSNPPFDPVKLTHIMAQSCIKHNGLGLSAPQIGLPFRCSIITGTQMICMFNPRIVSYGEEEMTMEEGCLSFPNLFLKIKRPLVIRVRFTLPNGATETRQFDGLTSRVVQHEIDHLDGILFTSRANPVHLKQGYTRKKKLERQLKKET